MKPPVALTIAGSDSGGGAGIEADLKTFEAFGVWGTAAIVAVTAQNTLGVQAFETLPPALVRAQVESVMTDIGAGAAKTGMLASASLVSVVAAAVRDFGVPRLVVDPVFVSKHGDTLLADDAVGALRSELLPLATVVTPNLPEAGGLVGGSITDRAGMVEAAFELLAMGVEVVLVKGGHLGGAESPDCLVAAGSSEVVWLEGARIAGRHTHGTGCVLSAAIAAGLARGAAPVDACRAAKAFVERAIARGVDLGGGVGPVNPGVGRPPTSHERMTGKPWDASYHDGPAPWDLGEPQPAVVRLAASGAFVGSVLDVGCGTGDNALHVAALGLPVLGVDVAETALAMARAKAAERGIGNAAFVAADAFDLSMLGRRFDTVLDGGMFHTCDADERVAYVRSLASVTEPGAALFVLCFSDQGPDTGPHPVSEAELRSAFGPGSGWTVASVEPERVRTRFHGEHGAPAWLATMQRSS